MSTFADILSARVRATGARPAAGPEGACVDARGRVCTICHASTVSYADEKPLRTKALEEYVRKQRLRGQLAPLVAARTGRGYRVVTKRKAFRNGRHAVLGLIDRAPDGRSRPMAVLRCAIEPRAHGDVYRVVQEKLDKPYASPLAAVLLHVVVKGGEEEQTVLFSVNEISRDVAHALNTLSKSLTHELPSVVAVYLFLDESRGTHYLGTKHPRKQPEFRRVYGKADVQERLGDVSFFFHPLAFSQVHPAVSVLIAGTLAAQLEPGPTQTLYDFYCGYGFFTLMLAPRVRHSIGVELSPHAVDSAIANARRLGRTNARFHRADVTAEVVQKIMHRAGPDDVVVLDPPRGGAAPGVIESIASRAPRRVAHLVCDIELLASDCARWTRSGYTVSSITPFDMFPGTDDIELLLILHPTQS